MAAKKMTLGDVPGGELQRVMGAARKEGLIIVMHPFYSSANKSYNRAVKDVLKKAKRPVLVFEESRKVEKTKNALSRMGAPPHLVLPTGKMVGGLLEGFEGGNEVCDTDHGHFIEMLNKAGVRKVWIGGQYSGYGPSESVEAYERSWVPKHRDVSMMTVSTACAGYLHERLIEGGIRTVRLMPNAIWPATPFHPKKPTGPKGRLAKLLNMPIFARKPK